MAHYDIGRISKRLIGSGSRGQWYHLELEMLTYGGELNAAKCIAKISAASEGSAGSRTRDEFLTEPIALCL